MYIYIKKRTIRHGNIAVNTEEPSSFKKCSVTFLWWQTHKTLTWGSCHKSCVKVQYLVFIFLHKFCISVIFISKNELCWFSTCFKKKEVVLPGNDLMLRICFLLCGALAPPGGCLLNGAAAGWTPGGAFFPCGSQLQSAVGVTPERSLGSIRMSTKICSWFRSFSSLLVYLYKNFSGTKTAPTLGWKQPP